MRQKAFSAQEFAFPTEIHKWLTKEVPTKKYPRFTCFRRNVFEGRERVFADEKALQLARRSFFCFFFSFFVNQFTFWNGMLHTESMKENLPPQTCKKIASCLVLFLFEGMFCSIAVFICSIRCPFSLTALKPNTQIYHKNRNWLDQLEHITVLNVMCSDVQKNIHVHYAVQYVHTYMVKANHDLKTFHHFILAENTRKVWCTGALTWHLHLFWSKMSGGAPYYKLIYHWIENW